MKRGIWEGLTVFDVGKQEGAFYRARQAASCNAVAPNCSVEPAISCEQCGFSCRRIDVFRRWEAAGCPIEQEGGEE